MLIPNIRDTAQNTAAGLPGDPAFLAAIVESSQDSIVSIDLEWKITSWNAAAGELYGYAAPEVLGKSLMMLTLPSDLEVLLRRMETIKSSQRVETLETVRVHQDGHRMSLSITMSPVRNATGEIIGISTIARDITVRRQAEETLRRNEEQFRKALEDAPIPIIMHAEDGQVLAVSQTWSKLTGYQAGEMANFEAWLNQAYGEGADAVREQMHQLFLGEAMVFRKRMTIKTRDGRSRLWDFNASVPGQLSDGRRYIVGMALDVTEHAGAEAALRASEERFKLIIENAREYAIVSLTLDRVVTSWNSGAELILGYSQEEIVGQTADLIFTPEDRAAGAPATEQQVALTDGRAMDERWHVRKSGERFWGSGVMMRMDDEAGVAVGLVKIFRDQTVELLQKQSLEAALQETKEARQRAEAATQAKDHFLAVLSHELRTPLTPILMAVHVLKLRKDLPESVIDALDMIQRNVATEAQFVDQILEMTRVTSGKLTVAREHVDVHAAIERAVEVTMADFEAKGQRLRVELEAAQFWTTGDAVRLSQACWNLLKNASKFTPDGGEICLRSRNESGGILIEVQDSGRGITAEALTRIFEPFEQESREIAHRHGGLGLGLAIASANVGAHGGTLRASSEGPGSGAKFTIRLPLQ